MVLQALNSDPEIRAKKIARLKDPSFPRPGRPVGVPTGFTAERHEKRLVTIKRRTKRIVDKMAEKDQFIADNKEARIAIEALVEIIQDKHSVSERIKASKALLDFVQKKPHTASEVTLRKAEDFLDDLASRDADT